MKAAQLLGILGLICCSDGLEMHCDIREGGAPCHGPLGGSLIIKLMGENTNVPKWTLKKDTITILKWEEKFKSGNDKSRYFFGRQNGSLTIASLTREDAGTYLLEGFDKDGNNISHRNFRIYVEAPVSTVRLTHQCLENGEQNVSCDALGEGLSYKWMLDGQNLTDSQLQSGSSTAKAITLKGGVSGRLACLVSNNVSNQTAELQIEKCEDYWPILVGVLVAVVLLLAIGGAVVFIYRKKQKGSTDTQELTYADVSVVNHRGKWQHREAEEMVAYSEVRFAQHPARTARPREESPVYSVVQVR
ncbi:T-cell surface antigen CD2-like isoform X2 [Synchiropus splendidus]|uniref:T-cell surface antigen CD2-like isoform X2 n=1 Tax=Synchiropus splendidus TaxID=270530 RepID=UPI00237E7811|nr:T-cell surface antigen CD2-like isoform X2 [Synchiropus splendidus]